MTVAAPFPGRGVAMLRSNSRTSSCLFVFLLFLASSFFLPCTVAAELRLFELQHRQANDLVDSVREMLKETSRVSAYRNVLLVQAESDELSSVAALVTLLDKAPAMLRVTVEQGRSSTGQERAAGGVLRVGQGNVAVQAGSAPVGGNATGLVVTDDVAVAVSLKNTERHERNLTSQFLTVMEGAPALISVGQLIPFTSQFRLHCHRHAGCVARVARVDIQKVDTGFEVNAMLLGERVQLDIRPFMAFPEIIAGERIVFHELETRVVVAVGEWLDLGGQFTSSSDLSREILGRGDASSTTETTIRLRIEHQ